MIAGSSVLEIILIKLGKHNLWVTHFSTLIEFLLLSGVFYIWKKKKRQKQTIVILASVFIVLWIVSKYTFESFEQYDNYTTGIARVLEIAYAISLLFDILQDAHTTLWKDARIWVASGVLIYSAGVILVFVLFNELFKVSESVLRLLWHINWSLLILSSILYFRGIMCREPQENYENQKSG
jgi:NADH:ubiquinone oxidoreductase subunit 6 (subunit J)